MTGHVTVVLSYFGRDDTLACVESIVCGDNGVRPLVVDNGSDDGVLEAVTERWGEHVSILPLATNHGFTGGMNAGLRWALDQGAETITVLNNDTVCRPGALSRLAATAAATGAAVAPEIRYLADPSIVWFGGGTIDARTGLARHLREDELATPDPGGLRHTEVLTGCCVTASVSVWRQVGLFDDRYFLNFEDSDWSLRARACGVPLIVDTGAVIEHRVSASFAGAFSYLGLYFYARNGVLFTSSHGVGAGGRMLRTARFLREHVVPQVRSQLSAVPSERGRETTRRTIVAGYALRDVVLSRFGPAPSGLLRRATGWAEGDR